MSYVIDGAGLTPTDVAAIRAMIEPWTNACVGRDWDRLLALCTEDVTFLPPNEATVQGPGVHRWLENFPTIKAMAIEIDHIEGAAQLACLRGAVKMTLDISGQEVLFNGKYTDLFRKQPDGTWRFALVIWNSNEPV
jgi:ketosteroid isomerase-like protein